MVLQVFLLDHSLQVLSHLVFLSAHLTQLLHVVIVSREGLLKRVELILHLHALVFSLIYLAVKSVFHASEHFFLAPQTRIDIKKFLSLAFSFVLQFDVVGDKAFDFATSLDKIISKLGDFVIPLDQVFDRLVVLRDQGIHLLLTVYKGVLQVEVLRVDVLSP